jgi:hypothetical protein
MGNLRAKFCNRQVNKARQRARDSKRDNQETSVWFLVHRASWPVDRTSCYPANAGIRESTLTGPRSH